MHLLWLLCSSRLNEIFSSSKERARQFILVSYKSSTDCMSHCAEHACDPRLTPFMSLLSPMNLTERDRHCVCVCCPTLITALPQQHNMYRILTPKIRTKWCWVISVSHLQPPTNAHGWARAHSPTVPLIEKLHSPKKTDADVAKILYCKNESDFVLIYTDGYFH